MNMAAPRSRTAPPVVLRSLCNCGGSQLSLRGKVSHACSLLLYSFFPDIVTPGVKGACRGFGVLFLQWVLLTSYQKARERERERKRERKRKRETRLQVERGGIVNRTRRSVTRNLLHRIFFLSNICLVSFFHSARL